MEELTILTTTKWAFAAAIVIKSLCYGVCGIFILKAIPQKSLSKFFKLYLTTETIFYAAWRLASLLSLIAAYQCLIYYSSELNDVKLTASQASQPALFYLWLVTLITVNIRSLWQGVVEIATVNQTIIQLKKVIKTKTILRNLQRTASLFAVISPVLGLKWAALSGLSSKILMSKQVMSLTERWFDARVNGHIKQFIATTLLIAVFEILFKLAIIGVAFYLAS